ncbi:uncharacterized protein [Argopecten irradians]|uniref:uncharacterized protein n=1 Tax=Argopecten irradians TaxID=31199 RepID=UPI0037243F91
MAQFIKVALTANGDVVNIPVENNYVNKQTLESQFIGAIGLKYEINGTWLAVPMENGKYKIPNLELSVQYVVVTTSASSNIDQARQILNKPNLARDVQKYFSPSSKFNPRSGYSRDIKVNTTRKTARECWRNKKIFTKVIKVCFVDEVCMPVTFSKNLSLFEAMFSFSSNDDEDTLKTNLIEIWQNSGVATSIATSSDITFLSYTSKILSVPITTKEFQWTGESLKSNVGQGRLYVMVKSSKGVSSQNASSTVTTISSNPQSASYNERRTSNIERSDRDARESCIEIVDSEDEELQRVLDESLQEAVE